MEVAIATAADIPAWRVLAGEVEPLFGPMVGQAGFESSLSNNVLRGSAFCVRLGDGPPGTPLLGGLLWSSRRGVVNWLAVTGSARRQGVGSLLVRHVLHGLPRPSEVAVTTFAADHPGGRAARLFYEHLGFVPRESVPGDPTRQIFRLLLPPRPDPR